MRRARIVDAVRARTAEQWCTALVVVACVAFVVSRLHPGLILADTTPTGGDTGAHVYPPAYLRDHLLPSGRLTGWSPGWYAGFPLYVFYPVVPALAIVGLDVALPYGIAMKLVATAGVVSLPAAAWAAGRLAGLRFPTPSVLAVSTVPFLFDQSFNIWGGNIESTLAGEFSFSIALSVGVLTFGLWSRALASGRGRALAAAGLGLVWVCHPIVAFYAALGVVTLTICYAGRRALRDAVLMAVVAGALASFWILPFLARRALMSSMGFGPLPEADQSSFHYLAPTHLRWVLAVAAVGTISSLLRRDRFGVALALDATIVAAVFPHFPDIGLWNARLLPFYFLCVYLLAGLGVVGLVTATARLLKRLDPEVRRWSLIGTPVASLGFVLVLVGLPLHALPGGSLRGSTYSWLGLSTEETNVVPSWSALNYGGYERTDAWPEYSAVMRTMTDVGRDRGCGRAEWEYDASLGRYGTPDAMMLLPYWTDGCIDSMEGLYYESSGTTPYHFLTASETSEHPSNPMAGLTYPGFDLARGIDHMRLLGVRYYMAFSALAVDAADRSPDLLPIARSGPWHVYAIARASLVDPLVRRPAVATGVGGSWTNWRDVAAPWFARFGTPRSQPVLTSDGPSGWQRVTGGQIPSATPLPQTQVNAVRVDGDDVRFQVSRPGVPVLVKVSYFPNWHVDGALGPYRATPNFMVVVPTQHDVHLHYGWTVVDGLAYVLSLLGLGGLGLLAWRRRFAPEGPPQPGQTDERPRDPSQDR